MKPVRAENAHFDEHESLLPERGRAPKETARYAQYEELLLERDRLAKEVCRSYGE